MHYVSIKLLQTNSVYSYVTLFRTDVRLLMTKHVLELFWRLMKNQHGATAVEYSIISVAMFLAIIPAFYLISSAVRLKFIDIGGYFSAT